MVDKKQNEAGQAGGVRGAEGAADGFSDGALSGQEPQRDQGHA